MSLALFAAFRAALREIRDFGFLKFAVVVLLLTVVWGFGKTLDGGVTASEFTAYKQDALKILSGIAAAQVEHNRQTEVDSRTRDLFDLEDCLQGAEQADMPALRCWLRLKGIAPPEPESLKKYLKTDRRPF